MDKRISNGKVILGTTFFFVVTFILFPASYPERDFDFYHKLISPQVVNLIPPADVYAKAAKAFSPWLTGSPWVFAIPRSCGTSDSCEFGIFSVIFRASILLILYCGFVLFIVKRRENKKVLFLALFVYFGFIAYGAHVVYRDFIQPKNRANEILSHLQKVSGSGPFPEGTIHADDDWNARHYLEGKNGANFFLSYSNPHDTKEQYLIHLDVYPTREYYDHVDTELLCPIGSIISDEIWECVEGGMFEEPEFVYLGFLDKEHTVFFRTSRLDNKMPATNPIPTFVKHYRKSNSR